MSAQAVPQHMEALAYGNHIRLERGRIKKQIRAGEITVLGILADTPAECEGMRLRVLIRAQPGWGPARTDRLLRRLGVNWDKPIRDLTGRQLALVRDLLDDGMAPFA